VQEDSVWDRCVTVISFVSDRSIYNRNSSLFVTFGQMLNIRIQIDVVFGLIGFVVVYSNVAIVWYADVVL
jgi:hypothetical protein